MGDTMGHDVEHDAMPGKEREFTCADCAMSACKKTDGSRPAFCPSTGFDLGDEQWLQDELADEETRRIFKASAVSAYEAYDLGLSRIEEIMLFAREMGAEKIGIAGCTSLAPVAHRAVEVFRENGFDVVAALCKVGALTNDDLGLDVPRRRGRTTVVCNPIYQARLLNEAQTDLNVMIGLCAGHDGLFMRHSDALCTALVVKDFKHGHCPIRELEAE